MCCELQRRSPKHLGTRVGILKSVRVLNYAALNSSTDSLNFANSLAGNSRYFQTNTLLLAVSKLANFKVMMEGCLKITTGNAFDPEWPWTALQLFQTNICIISCSNLFICCYNANLHYKSDQRWTLAGEDLGRKQKCANKSIDWSCWRPHGSSRVIPAGQEGPRQRARWDSGMVGHPMAPRPLCFTRAGRERGSAPTTSLFSLQPPKESHLKPHNSTWELWYSLFVYSRDKTRTWKIMALPQTCLSSTIHRIKLL